MNKLHSINFWFSRLRPRADAGRRGVASPETAARPLRCARLVSRAAVCGCLLLAGCGPMPLETEYGKRTGAAAAESVNGTSVLGDMFAATGRRVDSRRHISPKLMTAQTIVWAPDSFESPTDDAQRWFDSWLEEGSGRTLIYVGRDFDAAPLYWQSMQPRYSKADRTAVAGEFASAKGEFSARRTGVARPDCDWYTWNASAKPRRVSTLSGPWSDGINAAKTEIFLNGRMNPSDYADVLLASGPDALVAREYAESTQNQVIVVANGSFLLNMALVNHEHRALAGRLIDETSDGRVVFLESGPEPPKILDHEPAPKTHTGLEILKIWPMGHILLHFAVLGIIFCFARWPIFGLPAKTGGDAESDFGRHVEAVGKLLSKSGNRAYAATTVDGLARSLKPRTGARPAAAGVPAAKFTDRRGTPPPQPPKQIT